MISDAYKVLRALVTRRVNFEVDLIPFEFEGLPLKKVINWTLTESSVFFKPSKPWGFPTILQIEPTSHCNLRCRVCPVTAGMGRPAGHMELGLFKRIIDELGAYLLLILFWDWGEPFLNPDAYEMISYACRQGTKVISSTNGHVFAAGDHARKVVQSGLDVLVFSVDGITQETYQRYRATGSLATVIEGIRRVVAEKRLQQSDKPLINFRFIVMKHSEQEVPQLTEFARSLGVDALTIRKFHGVPNLSLYGGEDENDFVPTQHKHQLPVRSAEDQRPVRAARNPCKNLWNCPTIHWDGTVCSCFLDFSEEHPLGALRTRSFEDIWGGEAFRDLRRDFRENWEALPLCGKCSCGFEGGDIGRESNAEVILFPRP
jgi:MoaA/NifB/PqqE/SkfB family radical SAM enzyme